MIINSEDYISHDEFIEHVGVKGMRWGVRRTAKRDARRSYRASRHNGKIGTNVQNRVEGNIAAKKGRSDNYTKAYDKARPKAQRRVRQRAAVRGYVALAAGLAYLATPQGGHVAATKITGIKGKMNAPKMGQDGYKYAGDFIDTIVSGSTPYSSLVRK